MHDVRREVVLAADQRRADPVRVDRHRSRRSNAWIFSTVKPPGRDDLHALEAVLVERQPHLADEPLVDASRVEVAHLLPERAVDEQARRVEPDAPEARPQRAGDVERSSHRVVVEVHEDGDAEVFVRPVRELRRRQDGVAAVGSDEGVRHGADAAAAPPRRLRVRGDADLRSEHRAGDVRGIPVAGLDAVVVVPRRHEDDRLPVRGLEDAGGVRRDQRAPRERAEHDGLEVRERRVVALDRHDGLPRLDPLAVVERVDGERVPVVRAELEDRDRLVHASEHRVLALEDLHARRAAGARRRAAPRACG